jgi:hypothetical protein
VHAQFHAREAPRAEQYPIRALSWNAIHVFNRAPPMNVAPQSNRQLRLFVSRLGLDTAPWAHGRWDGLAIVCRGTAEDRCRLAGTFTAINPSLGPTPRVALRFYLSDDDVLDDADLLLAGMPVKPVDMLESQVRTLNVVLPPGTQPIGQFVIAFVDADDIVEESNEANNVIISPAID